MRGAYIDYSMSVIISRALPDVRDGLKPVHRRVLFAMDELGVQHNRPYKKSARIVGDCFIAGTLVQTPAGLIPIEKLEIGSEVFTQKSIRKVTHLYEMPAQPLLEIKTRSGLKNIATPGQKFKVFTPDLKVVWKEANALQTGDYLMLRSVPASSAAFQFVDAVAINEDLAWLAGFFLADGWIDRDKKRGYHRIAFANASKEIMMSVQKILADNFNCSEKISIRKNLFTLKINSSALNQKLMGVFNWADKYAHTIAIPESILQSPASVQFAFIAGFADGDGSVHKTRKVFNFASVSGVFLEQLQIILLSHGIYSHLYESEKRNKLYQNQIVRGNFNNFSLEISGSSFDKLSQNLPLVYVLKKERLTNKTGENKAETLQKLPFLGQKIFEEFSEKHLGGGWYATPTGNKIRAGIKYADGTKIRYAKAISQSIEVYYSTLFKLGIYQKMQQIDSPYLSLIEDFTEQGIVFSEVISVKPAGEAITYDIQVEEEHEFIANGMLVHNCLGKYHPHGDASVYDTMVRMAQPWSLRYPMVDGQGNFGSVDGDSPASMRYTEARLKRIAEEMLSDLGKNTVDFQSNYDDSTTEPTVLPAKVPNLLINGTSGIAVGMATNMAPHNLSEVADGIVAYIEDRDISILELAKHIPAPDFPTGGIIYGYSGVQSAFATGRGRVVIRSVANFETTKTGKEQIIVTEIPYMVNKANMIEKTAALINEKKIEGITALRDESDRDGLRIVYDLHRDAIPSVVLNNLFKQTALQQAFSVNNVALVKGRPATLNLKDMIRYFVEHRMEVIIRRTQYDLTEARKRLHILEGLLIALDNLDAVITLIRGSRLPEEAKEGLITQFGLSEIQAKAILELRLQRLTGLEREKIIEEYNEIQKTIADLQEIIDSEERRYSIIKAETLEMKDKYGDKRRSQIEHADEDFTMEDMIADEEMVITFSNSGYVKRTPLAEYRTQGRGGVGSKGATTREDDFTEHLFIATNHNYLLIFTENGKVFWLKVYNIPVGAKTSKGRAIQNLIQIENEDRVKAVINVKTLDNDDYINNNFVVMCTQDGTIKKTSLEAYSRPRQGGINAITINEGDMLLNVCLTNGENDIILASRSGMAVRFHESRVRPMGRTAAGVRGISLDENNPDDKVIGMVCISRTDATLLVVSEKGFGKRSEIEDYRLTNRGGKGVKTLNVTEKTGKLVAIKEVTDNDDLMIINKSGITIRMEIAQLRVMGRATQGVKLIRLNEDDEIASVAKIEKMEEEEPENGVLLHENGTETAAADLPEVPEAD